MIQIYSNTSDRVLTLSNRRGEFFTAKLGGNPEAAIDVSTYADEYGLLEFFRELADFSAPWQEKMAWSSLEEEFKISATSSSLGRVTFAIEFRGLPGGDEEWSLSAGVSTEFGQLAGFAKAAEKLFLQ